MTVQIEDVNGAMVKSFAVDEVQSAGVHSYQWNGKDSVDKIVAQAGNYTIKIIIKSLDGTQTVTKRGNIKIFQLK